MLLSIALYVFLAIAFLGAVSVVVPLRFLRIRSRRRGATLLAAGACLCLVVLILPARERRVERASSALDRVMPVWQFEESHSIRIAASPENVFEAIRGVRARDIDLFLTLTAIRRMGRPGPESIINAPEEQPLLDVATRTSFAWLADDPPRELVVGTILRRPDGGKQPGDSVASLCAQPRAGVTLAAMNFRVSPDGSGGSIVTTETRVFADGAAAARRFAPYWRVIRPGSGIIRVMWLRAIRARAEAGAGS